MPPIAVGVNTLSKSGSEELKGDVTLSAGAMMGLTQSAQDIQAALTFAVTSRIAARKTAGAGAGEEATLSEILDFIGSAAQGDILYRDAAAWARLGAGTSGQFLKTQGAAANPIWAADSGGLTLGTKQASTSGTAIDFTGIPAGTKLIIVNLIGVSLSGTDELLIQLGDAGGVEATGYLGMVQGFQNAGTPATVVPTTGFQATILQAAAGLVYGQFILSLEDASDFTWTCQGGAYDSSTSLKCTTCGSKSLSAELDRVRVATNGTNTFDAGEINIAYM